MTLGILKEVKGLYLQAVYPFFVDQKDKNSSSNTKLTILLYPILDEEITAW